MDGRRDGSESEVPRDVEEDEWTDERREAPDRSSITKSEDAEEKEPIGNGTVDVGAGRNSGRTAENETERRRFRGRAEGGRRDRPGRPRSGSHVWPGLPAVAVITIKRGPDTISAQIRIRHNN